MPLLEVNNLQTHFRTPDGVNRAVDGVSFQVGDGETLAVVGESGCGKSVTANSILRLVPEPPGKIAGSIRFQGRELLSLPERAMRAIRGKEIGMIFQEPMTSLNPVLSIGRKVEEAPVAELFRSPRHPYTQGLIGAVPKLGSSLEGEETRLTEIPGLVPSLKQRIEGCVFAGRCPKATDLCRRVAPALESKAP